jgi:hypothetical protein
MVHVDVGVQFQYRPLRIFSLSRTGMIPLRGMQCRFHYSDSLAGT